jgi:hypothetical protein
VAEVLQRKWEERSTRIEIRLDLQHGTRRLHNCRDRRPADLSMLSKVRFSGAFYRAIAGSKAGIVVEHDAINISIGACLLRNLLPTLDLNTEAQKTPSRHNQNWAGWLDMRPIELVGRCSICFACRECMRH